MYWLDGIVWYNLHFHFVLFCTSASSCNLCVCCCFCWCFFCVCVGFFFLGGGGGVGGRAGWKGGEHLGDEHIMVGMLGHVEFVEYLQLSINWSKQSCAFLSKW